MDCGRDNKVFRRLNAIHLLLVGVGYDLVLRNSRVSGRMLRLWISRFNAQGIDGLTYKSRSGRPRNLDVARVVSNILPLVDDPALANQTHWTVIKLCGWLCKEKQIDLSYRTLVRYLHEHLDVRKIPRLVPEPPNLEAWEDQFLGSVLGFKDFVILQLNLHDLWIPLSPAHQRFHGRTMAYAFTDDQPIVVHRGSALQQCTLVHR